ncbi:twin-arginine translocase subunit TatC [Patescibacteria group bacterium]|nr:MAG: twin-arginine translocase subunit TatC [Patescibacteria group bacterium]
MAVAKSVHNSHHATKLVDHIRELRRRLLVSVFALVVAGVVVYAFYEPLLNFLRSPLGAPLFYSSPSGSFSFVMKICFMGALAIAIPVIIFNLIMFIRPAFSQPVPIRRVVATSFMSAILAFAGAAFGFYYIIPGALRFFAGFQVSGLNALISADSYLGFVTNVIITFVLVFQLPLLMAFIDRIKPLRPQTLLSGEKWVILGSLVISILVPFAFDVVTTLLIALPIIVLYNLSIVIIAIQHAQMNRKAKALQPRFDLSAMPNSTLSLEVLSFEDLVGQPVDNTEQTLPVAAVKMHTNVSRQSQQTNMDIRARKIKPSAVTPPEWVNRVHEPIPLDPRARLVSF